MRMRRKRNLEPRLAACGALLLARGKPLLNLKEAAEHYRALIDYEAVFGNCNPVRLEIGCGNGRFIREAARREPQVIFLGVELNSNVIVTAMENLPAECKNVRFLNIAAEILPCYIPEESVGEIYLNFSTPLPEHSRERQRLTSARFLAIYRALLKEGGRIVQKTDSEAFFDYSAEQFLSNGFSLTEVTRNLQESVWAEENIVTEYEAGFLQKGCPIYRQVAVKRSNL